MAGPGPVDSAGRCPTNIHGSALNSWAKVFRRPMNPAGLHPTNPAPRVVILGLDPRIFLRRSGGIVERKEDPRVEPEDDNPWFAGREVVG